jgi:hypothetical protein
MGRDRGWINEGGWRHYYLCYDQTDGVSVNFGALSHSVNHTAIPATLHNNGNPLPLLFQQTAQQRCLKQTRRSNCDSSLSFKSNRIRMFYTKKKITFFKSSHKVSAEMRRMHICGSARVWNFSCQTPSPKQKLRYRTLDKRILGRILGQKRKYEQTEEVPTEELHNLYYLQYTQLLGL